MRLHRLASCSSRRNTSEPLSLRRQWPQAPVMRPVAQVTPGVQVYLFLLLKCSHWKQLREVNTKNTYIYIWERTKPITSAKGRGWNGHRFLCVPHRSWGFNVCNKIRQTCVSKVIVFCVTPIVPESFMIVSSINVLVRLFQIVGGFGGRSNTCIIYLYHISYNMYIHLISCKKSNYIQVGTYPRICACKQYGGSRWL